MSKKSNQKLKLICVLDVLRKFSDEENPLSANEISEHLLAQGIEAERKSIYADIEALIDYGYDIVRSFSGKKGFFLGSRDFEEAEIFLLSDAVRTARFISPKKTRQLLSKLDSMLSSGQVARREKNVYFDAAQKCGNEEIFYNIDTISKAISQKQQVVFNYTSRELKGREFVNIIKPMQVSPYALTWQDDHYYLICNYEKYDNLLHLRLDRITKANICETASRHFSQVSEYKDYFDIADYTNRLFGMHSGNLVTIELCCKREMAKMVSDRFSENIFITNVTETEFCFSYKAAISEALVTYILNFGDGIKVIKPQQLKDMIVDRTKKVLNMYEK